MQAEVLIGYGAKSLDKTWTYLVPEDLVSRLKVGMKVRVPFGLQKINGFVLRVKPKEEVSYELKYIEGIVQEELILGQEFLDLGIFLKETTLCSLSTAYQTMLPTNFKINKSQGVQKLDTFIKLACSREETINYIQNNKISKTKSTILEELLLKEKILKNTFSSYAIKSLLEEEKIEEVKCPNNYFNVLIKQNKPSYQLMVSQKEASFKIEEELNNFKTILLYGVTGSGKTDVYINVIDTVVKSGKSAIMLVPEITLTAQIVKRFYDYFGNKVAVFHSSLSTSAQSGEYLKILKGEVSIVVGTRSSVFAPLKNLGIIIIDEEHSDSYKQDNNPRYNAKNVAEFRCKYHNIPLVLASATPSLESMARGIKGNYKLIKMLSRVNNQPLPKIEIIDMKSEVTKHNLIFSEKLKNEMNKKLTQNEQIILLLNRRGYSTVVTCQNCGWVHKCPNCEISLTFHKHSKKLECHYCGHNETVSSNCCKCHKNALNYLGTGTEKLEEELKKVFPNLKVARMDADTTSKRGSHEQIIRDFKMHKYDCLLGTQMISKGLDFPSVTLVGVINADATLNIPDFRSSERTFQLLNQVAGRAGRGEKSGEVVIQSFNPDHAILNLIKNNDYEEFFLYEMSVRKKLGFPPYYYLVLVKIESIKYETAKSEAEKCALFLKNNLDSSISILGPSVSNYLKINNKYYFQIIIKYKKEKNLLEVLTELDLIYVSKRNTNLIIDTSPNYI